MSCRTLIAGTIKNPAAAWKLPILRKTPQLREENAEAFNNWCNEIGASKGYSKFKPFEDPSLVEDAGPFKEQLKIELIKNLQKQITCKS